jgi:hypothetical protein
MQHETQRRLETLLAVGNRSKRRTNVHKRHSNFAYTFQIFLADSKFRDENTSALTLSLLTSYIYHVPHR